MAKPTLTVINGTPPPDTPVERSLRRVRSAPKPGDMVQCPRCGGREVIETRTGVMRRPSGSTYGGVRVLICACCQRNGERVVV